MKTILRFFLLILVLANISAACRATRTNGEDQSANSPSPETNRENSGSTGTSNEIEANAATGGEPSTTQKNAPTKQARTVREFFNLLPQKYFPLEGCADNPTERNCARARAEYLKTYLEVEDSANGYLKAGCDGAQSCLQMALFKRPGGDYLVGLEVTHETSENYFLDYQNGVWLDVGAKVVPDFSKNNFYEIPRYGTTVQVFKRRQISEAGESEKGAKLYELSWKDGKFTVQR